MYKCVQEQLNGNILKDRGLRTKKQTDLLPMGSPSSGPPRSGLPLTSRDRRTYSGRESRATPKAFEGLTMRVKGIISVVHWAKIFEEVCTVIEKCVMSKCNKFYCYF